MNFVALMKRSGLEVATESTLLFETLPNVAADDLIGKLGSMLNGDPVTLVTEGMAGTTRYLSLKAGGCNINLETTSAARQPAAYFDALDWPMLHRTFPDAEEVTRRHRAHVHISVESEYDAVANALGMKPVNTSFARYRLTALVAAAVCRIAMPLAIHWRGCEMLYKPGPFIRQLETEPIDLFVRVTPFSSNRLIQGIRAIGASTRGVYEMLGREVVLEEAPVPVDWAMRTLQGFVARSQHEGAFLPHLTTYSPAKGDIMIVRHFDPTPEIDEPHISIEVRRAEEWGFNAATADRFDAPPDRPRWDGIERRTRPRTAKPFGRRGLG